MKPVTLKTDKECHMVFSGRRSAAFVSVGDVIASGKDKNINFNFAV